MSAARSVEALVALRRFGLGPRPGDIARIAQDPRGALDEELAAGRAAEVPGSRWVVASHEALRLHRLTEEERRRNLRGLPRSVGLDLRTEQYILQSEAAARLRLAGEASIGLAERLVLFWTNHFAVAVAKGSPIRALAGAFEREAIRPHVFGRFADMLRAAEQHPAMLFFLDNHLSVGPNSRRSPTGRGGLNENLAREILELHTLGVDGGYSQDDVASLARIITGWTFTWPENDALYGGRFTFAFGRHEPGAHALLGRAFADGGLEQGEAALDFLARHPATARHVARKLAAHFLADRPPPGLVARLEAVFLDTEGDLGAVTRALLASQEAWEPKPQKLRSPVEFVLATARLIGKPDRFAEFAAALETLGQPLWDPPGPQGFPDSDAHWGSPAGVKARLDAASRLAALAAMLDPNALVGEAFGPAASRETRQAVRAAESRAQGLALLLMAPEFQRR